MIKAYFDDYNKICIEINKNFYNGDVNEFKLKTKNKVVTLECKLKKECEKFRVLESMLQEDIQIDNEYYIDCEYGYKTDVMYRYIVQTEAFNKIYQTQEELGNFYCKDQTIFKLWAPTAKRVMLQVFLSEIETYEMKKENGIFSTKVCKDLQNIEYNYLVFVNNEVLEVEDLYAISVTNNSKRSVVINTADIMMFEKTFKHVKNPSIYELSVKYFTASKTSNHKHSETFKGLYEKNTYNKCGKSTGFDYIKDLGITHIQLMPINSFHTIDDYFNDTFNWGYDPQHFIALKNSYSSCCNYIDQINEFKHMVKSYNDVNIGVNIDVVYNHVYDTCKHAFNKIVPYYYYRRDSNGSFCGNDIATEMPMARHYVIYLIKHLVDVLQIDGIRFDLMGLMDIDTVLEIKSSVCENIMLYGEGWDMPTKLDDAKKSMHKNYKSLPNIGFFNDLYRDSFRGKNTLDGLKHFDKLTQEDIAKLINGEGFTPFNQSINYVECHDDYTLFDKIKDQYENPYNVIDFINKILIISRGITFIHSGQETYRTKNNISNTYCMGYDVNNFDWDSISKYDCSVAIFKEYLQLKKLYNLGYEKYSIEVGETLKVMTDKICFTIDKDHLSISYVEL